MVRLVALLLLLTGCAPVAGEPVPGSGPVTAQVDVAFRPVVQVAPEARPDPPDTLADADGTVYRLGPAIGDLTRFEDVRAEQGEHGGWVVQIELSPDDAREFGEWTTAHVGDQLAIVVDGEIVTAPTVQSPITGGTVQIAGRFTEDEARALATAITG